MSREIDYAGLARALLDRAETLVPQWLPGGTRKGAEWVCADLGGGRGGSCSVNLVTGAWADFSGDARGGDLLSLYAAIHGLSQGQAARRLMDELGWQQAVPARPVRGGAKQSAAGMPVSETDAPAGDGRDGPPLEAYDDSHRAGDAQAGRRRSLWRAVVPVPAHAPAADFRHWHYTQVAASWEYRFEGQLYGHVVRFATSDGGKEILPHTWCVDESDARGTQRWHWKQWDAPRPLYVPAQRFTDERPVVLVEGEKCALAGHELLGAEFDFVSWPGGANAWAKASWGWLGPAQGAPAGTRGRTVYLWPDCDAKREKPSRAEQAAGVDPASKPLLAAHRQPGLRAMTSIGSLLAAEHGCTVLMCTIPKPGEVADGWDLADAIAGGWAAGDVRAFIRAAQPFVPPDDAARARADGLSTPGLATAGDGEGGGDGGRGADERWRAALLKTDKGVIKAVRENIVLALDGWPERGIPGVPEAAGVVAFNEFTNNVEKTRPTPWGTDAGVWLEADELLMGEWLVREHWLPSMSRSTLEEAVLMVAQRHAFHPVRAQMLALRGRWDRTARLDTWLRRVLLEEDEYDERDALQRYLACAGKWFLMAMVCRVLPLAKEGPRTVRGPGTKFDYMLILESPQGWGKSTLAAVLGGDYFADTGLIIGDKDSYQNIQGVRAYEWGELENMTRQEVTKVKLFVSSPKDRFRASFDRRPRDYPRQVVFIGTTNERNYLTDVTGNRRFWPVQLTRPPDIEWLRQNLDQMFAEALHRLDAGERFWPSREEQAQLFDPQQRARAVESALEAEVRRVLYDPEQEVPHGRTNLALVQQIGLTELLSRLGYSLDKQTDVVVKKVGALMHSMGWKVRRLSSAGRPRVYVRPPNDHDVVVREAPEAGASHSSTDPAAGGEQERAADDCPF